MSALDSGYSGTPLDRKLGVQPGTRVAVLGPSPTGFTAQLNGVILTSRLAGQFSLIVFFVTSQQALEARLPKLLAAREPRGAIWIAWPKRTSGVTSDLDDMAVRHTGLATGLVDNKVCAIDSTWSALRFVAPRGSTTPPT
jgi:hypothetical protein